MERKIVKDDDEALGELGELRSLPPWMEGRPAYPLGDLSGDEFEIFCFLLLRRLFPADRVYYYGKTGDAGRDIIHVTSGGKIRLFQCKCYSKNVGIELLREELAKLFTNVFNKTIPEKPDEVILYVVPDITGYAAALVEQQSNWVKDAPKAIRRHLKEQPPKDLLEFSATWWPSWHRENAISLTDQARPFEDLREEFFAVRKVIDASREDVREDTQAALTPIISKLDTMLARPGVVSASDPLAIMQSLFSANEMFGERENDDTAHSSSQERLQPLSPELLRSVSQLIERKLVAELSGSLGSSPAAVLQTFQANEPPPLPKGYVSRAEVVDQLRKQLSDAPVVVVTGYAESGKTSAISEFAQAEAADCFWFATMASTNRQTNNGALLLFGLSSYLGIRSNLKSDVATALTERILTNPLLIIIDDAQEFGDINACESLIQIANSCPDRLKIVFAATDSPEFVSVASEKGLAMIRLPGVTLPQTIQLYQSAGIELSSIRRQAAWLACTRTDGHIGLLRLMASSIRSLKDEADLEKFSQTIDEGLGKDAAPMHAALISRFRQSLAESEYELCRRLAIAIHPFNRSFAQAVFGEAPDFQQTWLQCVMRHFESHSGGRFSLPHLYQNGLREFNSPEENRQLHRLAADQLANLSGSALNPFEVLDSVTHRYLAESYEDAIKEACVFLAIAATSDRLDITEFLLSQFHFVLGSIVDNSRYSRSAIIRYYSIRTRLCNDVDQLDEAEASANKLVTILESIKSQETPEEQDAWAILFLHGSLTGNTILSEKAFSALRRDYFVDWKTALHGGPLCLRIAAFLKANKNPLQLIRSMLTSDQMPTSVSVDELWNPEYGYHFWRAVDAAIYFAIDHASESSSDDENRHISQLHKTFQIAKKKKLWPVAALLGSCLAKVTIDLQRDFGSAVKIARESVQCAGEASDSRTSAYANHILGDALRCHGKFDEAIGVYSAALGAWRSDEFYDRGQATLHLAISKARIGNHAEGHGLAIDAADIYENEPNFLRLQGHALLEAGVMAMHADMLDSALNCLTKAHAILDQCQRPREDWSALAHCSWMLADFAEQRDESRIPVPGFTLGLRDSDSRAEKMSPSVSTFMLGRACSALGKHEVAIGYFVDAISNESDLVQRSRYAYFGLTAAIKSNDLTHAVRFAILASMAPNLPESTTIENFQLNHLLSPVVTLAVNVAGKSVDAPRTLAAAHASAIEHEPENDITELLAMSLNGLHSALVDEDYELLEQAYQRAITIGALVVARTLAYLRTVRIGSGNWSTAELIQWQWRLCWLTIEVGQTDIAFVNAFAKQEFDLWNRIKSDGKEGVVEEIAQLSDHHEKPSPEFLRELTVCLSKYACEFLQAKDFALELGRVILHLSDLSILDDVPSRLTARMFPLLIWPCDIDLANELVEAYARLSDAVAHSKSKQPSQVANWKKIASDVSAIVETLQTRKTSPKVIEVLLELADNVPATVSPENEAHLYIWLRRHAARNGDEDRDLSNLDHAMRLLRTDRVKQLTKNKKFSANLRRRLAICSTGAQVHLVSAELAAAFQSAAVSRIQTSSIVSGTNELNDALTEAAIVIEYFNQLEQESIVAEDFVDIWTCCHERGLLRKLIGTLETIQNGRSEQQNPWLLRSIEDFRSATRAIRTNEDLGYALKSACEGRIVASFLELDSDVEYFSGNLESIKCKLGDDHPEFALMARSISVDPLSKERMLGDAPSWLTNEEAFQQHVDDMMSHFGLPTERRINLEDDLRKQVRIAEVQDEFCKYLQPLQNLAHTNSPATSYLRLTEYTCSCTLLNHQTVVDNDSINTVIDAMQRTWCNECPHREPGNGKRT